MNKPWNKVPETLPPVAGVYEVHNESGEIEEWYFQYDQGIIDFWKMYFTHWRKKTSKVLPST